MLYEMLILASMDFVQSVKKDEKKDESFSGKLVDILNVLLEKLMAPPTLGSVSFRESVYETYVY